MANKHMQTYQEKIWQIVEPVIESVNMELIYVECLKMKSRWIVRIFMDKEEGITLNDCSEISNQVGDLLDIHDIPPGPYTLEVSSPGLDRPLERDKDFIKFKGHNVAVKIKTKLEGIKNFRGILVDFFDDNGKKTLVLDVLGKLYHIPKGLITKARLEYKF